MAEATRRYAVVTGANKGIGLETVKQLASAGVKVVLTARDEKRGLEAVGKLRDSGLSELVVFHQLDVADPASVTSLADFIKSQFGKLDILVNNAGIGGVIIDNDALTALIKAKGEALSHDDRRGILTQTYELADECLEINYYGAKRTTEALLPLLHLSDSPRIVNVSSTMGMLQSHPNAKDYIYTSILLFDKFVLTFEKDRVTDKGVVAPANVIEELDKELEDDNEELEKDLTQLTSVNQAQSKRKSNCVKGHSINKK